VARRGHVRKIIKRIEDDSTTVEQIGHGKERIRGEGDSKLGGGERRNKNGTV